MNFLLPSVTWKVLDCCSLSHWCLMIALYFGIFEDVVFYRKYGCNPRFYAVQCYSTVLACIPRIHNILVLGKSFNTEITVFFVIIATSLPTMVLKLRQLD